MAQLLVVDPLLLTEEFCVGAGLGGDEHEVLIPTGFDLEDLRPLLERAEGILTAHRTVGADMITLAPNLRAISKPGAGVDNIDVRAATARGVVVTKCGGWRARGGRARAVPDDLPRATRLDARRPRVAGNDLGAARRQDAAHRRPRRDRHPPRSLRTGIGDVGHRPHTDARSRPGPRWSGDVRRPRRVVRTSRFHRPVSSGSPRRRVAWSTARRSPR